MQHSNFDSRTNHAEIRKLNALMQIFVGSPMSPTMLAFNFGFPGTWNNLIMQLPTEKLRILPSEMKKKSIEFYLECLQTNPNILV